MGDRREGVMEGKGKKRKEAEVKKMEEKVKGMELRWKNGRRKREREI